MGEDDPPPAMEGTARLFVRVVATPASIAPEDPRVDAPEEPTKVRSRPAQRAPSADIMISFRAVKRI
jgi:hypothetical protein